MVFEKTPSQLNKGIHPESRAKSMVGCDTTTRLKKKCLEVLEKFKYVLSDELPLGLPPNREVDHKIESEPGAQPPNKVPYRLTQVELKELKRQSIKLLVRGYI